MNAAELEGDRVGGGGRAALWACPDRGIHDGLRGWGVGKTVGVPPFGTSFALEEGRSRELVSRSLAASMTWVSGILFVEFRVMDLWEDFQGHRAEARSSLFLDFHVRAYLRGPLN